jgi:YaiO family outer membrane protein
MKKIRKGSYDLSTCPVTRSSGSLSLLLFVFFLIFFVGKASSEPAAFFFELPPCRGSALFSAQTGLERIDTDKLFEKARNLAREGKRTEAANICRNILERKPDYHEVRVYLARIHMWEKEYPAARKELDRLFTAGVNSLDAFLAIIDLEYWTGRPAAALNRAKEAMSAHPDEPELLIRYARVLVKLEELETAARALDRLLSLEPGHEEAGWLSRRVQTSTRSFKLFQRYRYDRFDRGSGDRWAWHMLSVGISGKLKSATLIGRVNYADRSYGSSSRSGLQYEVDAYPKFGRGWYAYLNAGYSSSAIFPKYRGGAEIFTGLPHSFEISAGARYLKFANSGVTIYTGSLGKYYRNFWFSFRPFVTSKPSGLSVSANLFARRYRADPENYSGILLGYGSTPIDFIYPEDIERLNSLKLGLEIQQHFTESLLFRISLRFEREELAIGRFGNRYVLELRLEEILFKKY